MRVFTLSLFVVVAWVAACDTTSSTIPTFGDPYTVQRRPAPVLEGDSLRVTVSYSGGCESHHFDVMSSLAGTELWLHHDANGDTCDAYLTRELYLPVDTSRLSAPPLRIYISRAETIELVMSSDAANSLTESALRPD